MTRGVWIAAVVLTGCNEYGFPEAPAGWTGEPNPFELEDPMQTDRLVQVIDPVVDVLWVVDNSESMQDDRQALADNFPLFMEWFEEAGVDYHIGVVTTDMDDPQHRGRLREVGDVRYITPDTPDAVERFTAMATRLKPGSPAERGREAAYTALELEGDGYNAGFLRGQDSGWLHITVVSDEDDDSSIHPVSKKEFASYIDTLKPFQHRTTFNSIVHLNDGGPFRERGTKYLWLTDEIGGVKRDISTSDWDAILDDLGGLQTTQPTDEFFLSRVPVPDSLDVKVVHAGVTFVYEQDVDYLYSPFRNSVAFVLEQDTPKAGAEVLITYVPSASQVGAEP